MHRRFDDRLGLVPDTDASEQVEPTSWRCPACLAEAERETSQCEHCRCGLVLGDDYVVIDSLASKGPCRTLAGIRRDDGTPVVIKTLSISGMADWKQLELFQRGIAVLRGVEHPGIPTHLADGELARGGETLYFWVQRRVEGINLAAGLEQGVRWTEARASALADAVLEILEYLQGFSPPILHRDIKPSNIIETSDGRWVLIDFDLVKDTLDPEGGATVALGTAGYAPLEQLMGRAVPASDLYGVGATLVAVLSRKSPADLLDPDGRVDFAEHVRVSSELQGFIGALLEPRVDRRPSDARSARERLRQAMAEDEAGDGEAVRLELEPATVATPLQSVATSSSASLEPTTGTSLTALEPAGNAMVRIDTKLMEEHPPPWWLMPLRLGLIGTAGVLLPAQGAVLGGLLVTLWLVSGFVVRFPVRLPPGRALFQGGVANTGEPGRYWLRRRWSEVPHSIPLDPLRLDWNPAPTRLEGGSEDVWLELSLVAWVRPRSDEVGQFFALLSYRAWTEHASLCAGKLRGEVLDAVVEFIGDQGLVDRMTGGTMLLGDELLPAIDEGLAPLGLERVALGEFSACLRSQTEDLSSEDRVRIHRTPPP